MDILTFNTAACNTFITKITNRMNADYAEQQQRVSEIIADVRANGDAAVFKYTEAFDKCNIDASTIRVTKAEIDAAINEVSAEMLDVLEASAKRILSFHEKQKQQSWFTTENEGEFLGQLVRPMGVAGIYTPGGTAPLASSLLMSVIPAKVAGVPKTIVCSPPNTDGKIPAITLAAAKIAGADEIYKVGGAQAIAAMAFGTQTIPRADIISGPGNIYVALAKKSVYGQVNIDSIAGPSEILILADETANPVFIAADMLSQAEHDTLASAVLLTTNREIAEKTLTELTRQLDLLPRKEIAAKSLKTYGAIILCENIGQAIELSNQIAPEHLEICTAEPFALLSHITNAGTIFMGNDSPEPVGDYLAGSNHILPTSGTARFFSPVGVDTFVKKIGVSYFTKDALAKIGNAAVSFAESEQLSAHAEAVRKRL